MTLSAAETTFIQWATTSFKDPNKYLYLDFEYRNSEAIIPTAICCVTKDITESGSRKWWLYENSAEVEYLKNHLLKRQKTHTFVCYSSADMRMFRALGLDPREFKWIDLMIEYQMCQNESGPCMYGRQLKWTKTKQVYHDSEIADKKRKDMDDSELQEFYKQRSKKLIHALSKFCWADWSLNHAKTKESIIPQIIGPVDQMLAIKDKILEYCVDDVRLLPLLHQRMTAYQINMMQMEAAPVLRYQTIRGRASVNYERISFEGIPLQKEWMLNLGSKADILADKCAERLENTINKPLSRLKGVRQTVKAGRYLLSLIEQDLPSLEERLGAEWPTTDNGQLKCDAKIFDKLKKKSGGRGTPAELAFAAGQEISKLKKAAFYKTGKAPVDGLVRVSIDEDDDSVLTDVRYDYRDLWRCISREDFRSRSPFWIFGTQTGRCTPSTSSCVPLLPKWMRTFMQPPEGFVIIDIDFSQQEFLLSALLSGDQAMIDAYRSGDVYTAFGKATGLITDDMSDDVKKVIRAACKAVVLGSGYGMGKKSLAMRIRDELGARAADFDDSFFESFYDLYWNSYRELKRWREDYLEEYQRGISVVLPYTGWCMGIDNPSSLSIQNEPVQGAGSSIMYHVVDTLIDNGYRIVFTLHDAISVMVPIENWKQDCKNVMDLMRKSTDIVIGKDTGIRSEADVWGYGLEIRKYGKDSEFGTEVRTSPVFIDPRSFLDIELYGDEVFGKEIMEKYVYPTMIGLYRYKRKNAVSEKVTAIEYTVMKASSPMECIKALTPMECMEVWP